MCRYVARILEMNFGELKIQETVDELCSEYRRLDEHLKHPKQKLPMSFENYTYKLNGQEKILISKFFRNIGALEKLESLINHLDPYFIAIEYFQNNINVERKDGRQIEKSFKDQLFLKIAADSIRSSFDIYAKFVSWFYDLPNKKNVGFSYEIFIEKLEKHSPTLKKYLNDLYSSEDYKTVNDFRNADKHIGFDRFEIDIKRSSKKFEISTKRIPKLDKDRIEHCLLSLLNSLKEIIKLTIDEFSKYELGYNSKTDFEVSVGEDGLLRG